MMLFVPSAEKLRVPSSMIVRLLRIKVPPAAACRFKDPQAWPVIFVTLEKSSTLLAPVTSHTGARQVAEACTFTKFVALTTALLFTVTPPQVRFVREEKSALVALTVKPLNSLNCAIGSELPALSVTRT